MEFLVHMEVAHIEGGEPKREQTLRDKRRRVAVNWRSSGILSPSVASAGQARELGHLES